MVTRAKAPFRALAVRPLCPQNSPMGKDLFASPFYRWENCGTGSFPEVMGPVSGAAWFRTEQVPLTTRGTESERDHCRLWGSRHGFLP